MCRSEGIKSLLSEEKVKQKVHVTHSTGQKSTCISSSGRLPGQHMTRDATTVAKLERFVFLLNLKTVAIHQLSHRRKKQHKTSKQKTQSSEHRLHTVICGCVWTSPSLFPFIPGSPLQESSHSYHTHNNPELKDYIKSFLNYLLVMTDNANALDCKLARLTLASLEAV